MAERDSHQSYNRHVGLLKTRFSEDQALRAAIGGQFSAVGLLEYHLLVSLGLRPGHFVVDVGCGSGRLAAHLATLSPLGYLGLDVVQDLLDYAQALVKRPDWTFRPVDRGHIPCADGQADFVCFFSVFTHLTHDETFRYLAEAKRVLKPGGKIVFSFLEFRIPCHWEVFAHSLQQSRPELPLNQFMDREGIQVWAQKLGLEVDVIADGDRPHIPIPHPIQLENGAVMEKRGNLGQSVAVLGVPRLPERAATPAPELARHSPAATAGRFVGLSARGYVGGGNEHLVLGFVVRLGTQFILARAIGPGLAPFGISNFLRQPALEVLDDQGRVVALNEGLHRLSAADRDEVVSRTAGLATFAATDQDAALLIALPAGAYTLNVRSLEPQAGVVLAEIYELPAT